MTAVAEVRAPQAHDPFPVRGIDHVTFLVGNAKQAAHYYSTAFGMTLIAYRGPEQGYRDYAEYVLISGRTHFVLRGAVHAQAPGVEHHAKHGDGVTEIALAVPDVDSAYDFAVSMGASGLQK